jgi:hypothetical protein
LDRAFFIQTVGSKFEPRSKIKIVHQKQGSPQRQQLNAVSSETDLDPCPKVSNSSVRLRVNLDNLQETIGLMKEQIFANASSVANLQSEMARRPNTREMGQYFQKMAAVVPKDIHEKALKIQLQDPDYVQAELKDVDAQFLRESVTELSEKLDLIAGAIQKNKRGLLF